MRTAKAGTWCSQANTGGWAPPFAGHYFPLVAEVGAVVVSRPFPNLGLWGTALARGMWTYALISRYSPLCRSSELFSRAPGIGRHPWTA